MMNSVLFRSEVHFPARQFMNVQSRDGSNLFCSIYLLLPFSEWNSANGTSFKLNRRLIYVVNCMRCTVPSRCRGEVRAYSSPLLQHRVFCFFRHCWQYLLNKPTIFLAHFIHCSGTLTQRIFHKLWWHECLKLGGGGARWQWWWNYAVACVDANKPDHQPLNKILSDRLEKHYSRVVSRTLPLHPRFCFVFTTSILNVQFPFTSSISPNVVYRHIANYAAVLSHSSHNIVPKQNTKQAIVTHTDECVGQVIFTASSLVCSPLCPL